MNRVTFKTLLFGQFAETHLQETIDKDKMLAFVDGGLFAYDFIKKQEVEIKASLAMQERLMPKPIHAVNRERLL